VIAIVEQVVELLLFRKRKNARNCRVVNAGVFFIECKPLAAVLCSGDKKHKPVIIVEVQGVLKKGMNIFKRGLGVDFKEPLPPVESVPTAE